jgi:hypothetical protein
VSFRPPPFPILVGSFIGSWLVLIAWLIARLVTRRRARAETVAAA